MQGAWVVLSPDVAAGILCEGLACFCEYFFRGGWVIRRAPEGCFVVGGGWGKPRTDDVDAMVSEIFRNFG